MAPRQLHPHAAASRLQDDQEMTGVRMDFNTREGLLRQNGPRPGEYIRVDLTSGRGIRPTNEIAHSAHAGRVIASTSSLAAEPTINTPTLRQLREVSVPSVRCGDGLPNSFFPNVPAIP
jgi:hypothetical protein